MGKVFESIVERTTIWTLLAFFSMLIVMFGAVSSDENVMTGGVILLVLIGLGRGVISAMDLD